MTIEAPEGWKELKLVFDERQLFYGPEVGQALDLMKEMAEALGCIDFDEEIPTIGKSYWIDEYDLKKAKDVLKRFREWK